jgi:hypothetical protein
MIRKHRKSPADLFRRQDKKKTERGRNWHDSKQPYYGSLIILYVSTVSILHIACEDLTLLYKYDNECYNLNIKIYIFQ